MGGGGGERGGSIRETPLGEFLKHERRCYWIPLRLAGQGRSPKVKEGEKGRERGGVERTKGGGPTPFLGDALVT